MEVLATPSRVHKGIRHGIVRHRTLIITTVLHRHTLLLVLLLGRYVTINCPLVELESNRISRLPISSDRLDHGRIICITVNRRGKKLPARRLIYDLDGHPARTAIAWTNAISVPSAIGYFPHEDRTAVKRPGRPMSVNASRATDGAVGHPRTVEALRRSRTMPCVCLHSPLRRKTASATTGCRRNAPSAWRNMRSGSSWRVWSACASSTRAALPSGLDARRSVLSTKRVEQFSSVPARSLSSLSRSF